VGAAPDAANGLLDTSSLLGAARTAWQLTASSNLAARTLTTRALLVAGKLSPRRA
jgi:hypothetical protein